MPSRILFAALFLLSSAASAQTVQLITADEAKMPLATAKPASRAITRGPGVKLTSADSVSGSFPLKVAFEPRGSSKIDPASVRVELLKGSGIDLTDRVKAGIKPTGIEIGQVSAPAGEHPIRITVRDDEGRLGTAEFKLTVK